MFRELLERPVGERSTQLGTGYAAGRRPRAWKIVNFGRFSVDPSPLGVAFFVHRACGVMENNSRSERERSVLIPEAAGVLGVSRRTVYYRIRDGRLQTIRTRGGSQRVLWSSIEALLRSMRPELTTAEPDAPHPEG